MYAFTFGLNSLASFPVGNYKYVSQLYDYVKLYKVRVCLKNQVKIQSLDIGSTTAQYNFTVFPGADPIITYPDYDGFNSMPLVGSSGFQLCPNNGDMTQLLQNKPGAKRHKAWRDITRTFYPKVLLNAAGDNGGTPYPAGSVAMQGGRAGWMANYNANFFTGQLVVAIPYLGQDPGQINMQPNFFYSICNKWYVGFKTPLYG